MKFRRTIDTNIDPNIELMQQHGLARRQKHSVGTDSRINANRRSSRLKNLRKPTIEQRLSASQEECLNTERLAFANCVQYRINGQLLPPARRPLHITVITL